MTHSAVTATLSGLGSGGPDHTEALTANANFIRFNVTSNHGDPSFISLREVRFYANPIPEPSTATLLGFGLAGVASLSPRRAGLAAAVATDLSKKAVG